MNEIQASEEKPIKSSDRKKRGKIKPNESKEEEMIFLQEP